MCAWLLKNFRIIKLSGKEGLQRGEILPFVKSLNNNLRPWVSLVVHLAYLIARKSGIHLSG